jgi:hypothetical protein
MHSSMEHSMAPSHEAMSRGLDERMNKRSPTLRLDGVASLKGVLGSLAA